MRFFPPFDGSGLAINEIYGMGWFFFPILGV